METKGAKKIDCSQILTYTIGMFTIQNGKMYRDGKLLTGWGPEEDLGFAAQSDYYELGEPSDKYPPHTIFAPEGGVSAADVVKTIKQVLGEVVNRLQRDGSDQALGLLAGAENARLQLGDKEVGELLARTKR